MRRAVTLLLLTLASCVAAPLPTVTEPPQPTASSAPVATVSATPEPPIKQFHPLPRALETIDVLASVCEARATTWLVYDFGMTKVYDADVDKSCRERGTL
jgi:hypothetical protein